MKMAPSPESPMAGSFRHVRNIPHTGAITQDAHTIQGIMISLRLILNLAMAQAIPYCQMMNPSASGHSEQC